MAHCPSEHLKDLKTVFTEIREWPFIKERAPGVFYLRQTPFLHFHYNAKESRRYAHSRNGKDWGSELAVPEPLRGREAEKFLEVIRSRYEKTLRK